MIEATTDANRSFVLVGASAGRFEIEANRLGMQKKCEQDVEIFDEKKKQWSLETKMQYKPFGMGDDYEKFQHHDQYHPYFMDAEFMKGKGPIKGMFSVLERQRLLYRILEGPETMGCAFLDLDDCCQRKVYGRVFALHHSTWLAVLNDVWMKAKLGSVPLDTIRDYFGEKVAFYFGFLGLYTTWLLYLVFFSLPFFAFASYKNDVDHYLVPFYGMIVCTWCTLLIEAWKRQEVSLAYKWDMLNFGTMEMTRPEYYNDPLTVKDFGFHSKRGFVKVNPERYPAMKKVAAFPKWRTVRRQRLGYIMTFLLMILCAAISLGILATKLYLQKAWDEKKANKLGGFLNGFYIMFMNMVWGHVGLMLTNFENNRTESEFENSLIIKTFAFQFINSYITFIYTAYIKSLGLALYGIQLNGEYVLDYCVDDNCFAELSTQVISVLVTKEMSRTMKGVLKPMVKSMIGYFKAKSKLSKAASASEVEDPMGALRAALTLEADLPPYEGVVGEYAELAIQLGFVTLFAVAFPLAPLICFLNNMLERKTDAQKLLNYSQKPRWSGAMGIGSWLYVFEAMSILCIVTNSMVLLLTSKGICEVGDWFLDCQKEFHIGGGIDVNAKLLTVIFFEHIFVVMKIVIAYAIPDVPHNIEKALALDSFIQEYEDALQGNGKHPFPRMEVDDAEVKQLKFIK